MAQLVTSSTTNKRVSGSNPEGDYKKPRLVSSQKRTDMLPVRTRLEPNECIVLVHC